MSSNLGVCYHALRGPTICTIIGLHGGTVVQRVAASDPASTALKAIDVLEHLAPNRMGLGLTEISRRLQSSRGSVLRILGALERKGLVRQDPVSKQYRLTLRVLELSAQVLDKIEIQDVAKPHLERLSHLSGETVHLGVLDGWDVVFVGKAEPTNPVRLHSRIGYRVRSHCTALGKALLAALPGTQLQDYVGNYPLTPMTPRTVTSPDDLLSCFADVRTKGYAIDAEEHRQGICCIAAPIWGHGGQTVAAVSVSGPVFRMTAEQIPEFITVVKETAKAISRELGYLANSQTRG